MPTIVWIVVISVGAYFLFFRKGNSVRQPESDVEAVEPVAAIPEPDLTVEEVEIAKACAIVEAGSDARDEAFLNHKASLRDAETKLSKADQFVRESELDVAVPWLFDEMEHWPSWVAGDHDWKLPVDIVEVEGDGTYGDRWVSWKWHERKFKIHFKKHDSHGYSEQNEYSDFAVEADDQRVLKLNCSRDWSKEFDRWHYFGVDVLKVGPWISELVAFYQEARLAHERENHRLDAEFTLERADGIDFGEADEA